jgi:hypothetical protein
MGLGRPCKSDRGVVRNNLIIDAGWEGIGLYAAKDAQIYNNTLVNATKGGLYHSAIYFGITYQDWEPHPGRPASVNPNIHHNIVSQPSSIVRPMIEIRYDNNSQLGQLSALSGKPVMNNNCYYIEGKNASFNDRRLGSLLENGGLSAWKAHISGDSGSLEVNPALDADYLTTNSQCAGMGILCALTVTPQPDIPPVAINIAAILGVTPPVSGAVPVVVITETAQYSGTVTWSGNPATFGINTVYTATITITAKPGFTLTGVGANFFTVSGATAVTNLANSGVITAVFPATDNGGNEGNGNGGCNYGFGLFALMAIQYLKTGVRNQGLGDMLST